MPTLSNLATALRRCCAKFGLGRDLWRKDKAPAARPKDKAPSIQPKGTISREEWIRRKQQQA